MKKLFLILLFTVSIYPQSPLLTLMDSGVSYKNTETTLYLASLTTPISQTYAATLDSFITKVKDSLSITSLSSKFDVMYDLGGETKESSKLNLVKRSSDITEDSTGSYGITWTQWEGFQGSQLNGRLNTHYSDSTNAVNFSRSSASIGIYSRTDLAEATIDYGIIQNSTIRLYIRYTDNNIYYTFLSDDIHQGAASNTDSRGLFVMSATSLTNLAIYRNGNSLGSISNNVVGLRNTNPYYINGYNIDNTITNYSTLRQYSFFFVASGLSAPETSKLTNCIEWLMDRKGTGVIP